MESKKKKQFSPFRSGLNCAQSVLLAYSEQLKFDKNLALSISCGFGGGMGRLQETCGVVTGAFMALGVYNCKKYTDNKDRKDKTYAMVQDFNAKFVSIHKTAKCRELLNCDLKTLKGKRFFTTGICMKQSVKCMADAIDILDGMMN